MKKLFILATVLIVGIANAASVSWGVQTAARVNYDGSSVGKKATAYVVFLGSDSLSGLSYEDVIAKTQVGGPYTTSVGQVKNQNVTVDSVDGLGNYALYMTYVGADEKTYYNVSTSVYTLTAANVDALLNEGTALPMSSFAFTDSKPGTTLATASASSGGWVAVPEPASAALALAGLAMLIKRRKA